MTADSGVEPRDDVTPLLKRPALSWGVKIRKKLKAMAPFLGKFRPVVGQCCHQCTPESLGRNLLQKTPALGFQNLLYVNETHTRYRGWLVRRVCCVLFILSRKVDAGPVEGRLLRICSTDRVKRVLTPESSVREGGEDPRGILTLAETFQSPTLIRLVGWLLLRLFSLMFCSVQVNLSQISALHRAKQPKLGMILLPDHAATEQEAETHHLYSPVMTSLVGELLRTGESLSVGLCEESGRGGQWLARVHQAMAEGLVPDVSVVPVGISYDCPPSCQSTHTGGVRVSVLCRDVCWLLEEVLFRRCDVGFGGSLLSVVFHALSVLRPHLLLAAVPPSGEPLVTARPDPHTMLTLAKHSQLLTHVFISEAVGGCGGGEMKLDVALGQEELAEKSLQLTHLLPAGYIPVLMEEQQSEAVYLEISPLFLQAENKHKLFQFVSQFLYG
ncbi:Glycerol-3-phosphate acyltransferase 1, mitochondrial [Bagarius yarrelli]|uniref:Glycerol-3-phosphate acyltransferase 1, mitochondrial n=1 Tax=Bagarius yarrelli TaxID=175774 RepID=A0A556UFQ5_BAGYA|nr:Glycerol-3-phosphate acyltransferase 1, mitochondrial [Bagarius yarrelli]